MKPKEELLKIYSAYLPYELIVRQKFGRYSPTKNEPLEIDDLKTFSMHKVFKPILYSMDYLTKEIEHNGERFIPIVEILKKTSLLDLSGCKFDVYQDEEKFTQVVYVNAEDENGRIIDSMYYDSNIFWHMNNGGDYNPTSPQSEPQEMLLKFHFNVFGLDESEYIKKQSVIQK